MDVILTPRSPGHNGGGTTVNNSQGSPKDKEKRDRLIAAEVMTKFSLYAEQSEQSNTNNNTTTTSFNSRTSNIIITSTTADSIITTSTRSTPIIDNIILTSLPYLSSVNVQSSVNPSIIQKKKDILKPSTEKRYLQISDLTIHRTTPSLLIQKETGIPLKQEKHHNHHQQQKQEEQHSSDGRTLKTRTDNFSSNVPFASLHPVISNTTDTRKLPNNSVEQRVMTTNFSETTNKEKTQEKTFHTINNNNNNNSLSVNLHISNFSTTLTNSTKNIRKKSLPVLNARILKELLDPINNQCLVYLIHPFNENYLVRSINKKDFINCFLKGNQKLSGNFTSASSEDLLQNHLTKNSENENPIWGIIKNNRTIHFFEPRPNTPNKDSSTNILSEPGDNHRSSENNINKDLLNSVNLNSGLISEPSPNNEKLTSTLPLKKRKVAVSVLSDYCGTLTPGSPSSNLLATPGDSSRLLKSVSQLAAEECVRDRSIFIVFPSDVPKLMKSVSSNKLDDRTNQQLTKNIEIALHQDEDGDLPLHIAAVQKDLKMVSLYGKLIQLAGKSVDRFNKKHLTPLHFCVKVKFLAGIKKLIQLGADVNTLDGNGQSALHIAVSHSDLECFDFMMQQCMIYVKDAKMKPNLNSHDYEGVTLLHTAVNNNNIEMIGRLLQKGAELDAIDFKSGRSPLFYAVENKNINVVEFLLEKRATVDIPNFAGNTAYLAANCRGYHEISKLLADNGADTRGLISAEELVSNPKTTSSVKSQLKNKLVSSKANQILEEL